VILQLEGELRGTGESRTPSKGSPVQAWLLVPACPTRAAETSGHPPFEPRHESIDEMKNATVLAALLVMAVAGSCAQRPERQKNEQAVK
jgi:hypothetical protein